MLNRAHVRARARALSGIDRLITRFDAVTSLTSSLKLEFEFEYSLVLVCRARPFQALILRAPGRV